MEMRAVAGKMPLFVTDMLRLAFLPCTFQQWLQELGVMSWACHAHHALAGCVIKACVQLQSWVQLCCRLQRDQCVCADRLLRARSSLYLVQQAQVSLNA